MKKILFLILICFSFVFYSGFGCKKPIVDPEDLNLPKVTLEYWRTIDNQSDFTDLVDAYTSEHPNVTINTRFFKYEDFENELKNAWIDDAGPDIFSIPATWVGEYVSKNKILEMPVSTKTWREIIKDPRKPDEKTYEERLDISPTMKDIKDKYVDVVYKDIVRSDKIYGLPLAMDTLALYYNRELLNVARIEKPPLTWTALASDVRTLRKIDSMGKIIQAGASLGLVSNVDRAFDIVSLLMLQGGSTMECGNEFCLGSSVNGMDSVTFYTSFANKLDDNYTWDSTMSNSVDAFAEGKVAYFLGYSYHNALIKAKNPSLNYYITSVPQLEGATSPKNYANYFVEVVAKSGMNEDTLKKEQKQPYAWDFVKYITSEKNVMKYLDKTKKPTVLRSLIEKQRESGDADLSVFVDQLLTAKNWYHGTDYKKAEKVLNDLVLKVLESDTTGQTLKEIEQDANQELQPTW